MKIMYNIHKRAVQWREQFIHNKRSDDRNCCIHTASSNATPSLREMIKLWLTVLYILLWLMRLRRISTFLEMFESAVFLSRSQKASLLIQLIYVSPPVTHRQWEWMKMFGTPLAFSRLISIECYEPKNIEDALWKQRKKKSVKKRKNKNTPLVIEIDGVEPMENWILCFFRPSQ